jgi:hypothetical protein
LHERYEIIQSKFRVSDKGAHKDEYSAAKSVVAWDMIEERDVQAKWFGVQEIDCLLSTRTLDIVACKGPHLGYTVERTKSRKVRCQGKSRIFSVVILQDQMKFITDLVSAILMKI